MMKKLLIPLALAVGFALMAAGSLLRISGSAPGPELSEQERNLLQQALAHPYPDASYNVVSRESSAELLLGHDAAGTEAKKQALIAAFGKKGYAVSALVERLYQRNAGQSNASPPLPLESALAQGYLIDDGTYAAYFKPGGGGWEKLHHDHPQAKSMVKLSLPAYDARSGLFMVYINRDNTGGVGLYQYENGALRQLDLEPLGESSEAPR